MIIINTIEEIRLSYEPIISGAELLALLIMLRVLIKFKLQLCFILGFPLKGIELLLLFDTL